MNDIILVNFFQAVLACDDYYPAVAELIRSMPSVTSIFVPDSRRLPAIQRDAPLFINDYHGSNKIETFLHDNQSQLARTRRTHVFLDTAGFFPHIGPARLAIPAGDVYKIAISFFGPPSGNLILKLSHLSHHAKVTLILKESHGPRTFEHRIPSFQSLTVTNITLFPSPSDRPSFVQNTRNDLVVKVHVNSVRSSTFWQGYTVRDIRLHDEAGNDYNDN